MTSYLSPVFCADEVITFLMHLAVKNAGHIHNSTLFGSSTSLWNTPFYSDKWCLCIQFNSIHLKKSYFPMFHTCSIDVPYMFLCHTSIFQGLNPLQPSDPVAWCIIRLFRGVHQRQAPPGADGGHLRGSRTGSRSEETRWIATGYMGFCQGNMWIWDNYHYLYGKCVNN